MMSSNKSQTLLRWNPSRRRSAPSCRRDFLYDLRTLTPLLPSSRPNSNLAVTRHAPSPPPSPMKSTSLSRATTTRHPRRPQPLAPRNSALKYLLVLVVTDNVVGSYGMHFEGYAGTNHDCGSGMVPQNGGLKTYGDIGYGEERNLISGPLTVDILWSILGILWSLDFELPHLGC